MATISKVMSQLQGQVQTRRATSVLPISSKLLMSRSCRGTTNQIQFPSEYWVWLRIGASSLTKGFQVISKMFLTAVRYSIGLLLALVLLGACRLAAVAQTRPIRPPDRTLSPTSLPGIDDEQAPSERELEMKAKREIKGAEKEHQDNVDRAKEVSTIGKDLAASYKLNNSLKQDDLKTLDKLEKLTKRIRSEAGASDDEGALKEKPKDMAAAMECIAKVSNELGGKVQKTPRRVVSTAIIEQANVLLELIRLVRGLAH